PPLRRARRPIPYAHQAEWIIDCLCHVFPLFANGNPLGKRANLHEAIEQPGTGKDGWQIGKAEAFIQPIACEGFLGLSEKINRPSIVAERVAGYPEVEMGGNLEGEISYGRADGTGTLAGRNGAVILARHTEVLRHIEGNPPQPVLIVQDLSKCFGSMEVIEDPSEFS